MNYQLIEALVGNKDELVPRIYRYFPENFTTYLEPFCGSYVVPLSLPQVNAWSDGRIPTTKLPVVILNDLDKGIIDVAKALLFDPDKFYESTANWIRVEGLYNDLKKVEFESEFRRGIKKLYLIYNSLGRMSSPEAPFGYQINELRTLRPQNTKKILKEIVRRLQNFIIFNRDYRDFLELFYGKVRNGFVYLDPPYEGNQMYDGFPFSHDELAEYIHVLGEKTKFLLSYNKSDTILELYKGYNIYEIQKRYKVSGGTNKFKTELLICNYKPPNHRSTGSLVKHL